MSSNGWQPVAIFERGWILFDRVLSTPLIRLLDILMLPIYICLLKIRRDIVKSLCWNLATDSLLGRQQFNFNQRVKYLKYKNYHSKAPFLYELDKGIKAYLILSWRSMRKLFCENSYPRLDVSYFCKEFHHRCSAGF